MIERGNSVVNLLGGLWARHAECLVLIGGAQLIVVLGNIAHARLAQLRSVGRLANLQQVE